MGFDRFWLCRTADPSTWTERRQAEKNGKLDEFESDFARLEELGHVVLLSHGANFLFEELYAFENEADAVAFYEEGYKGCERFTERPDCGFPQRRRSSKLDAPGLLHGFGFQEVSLYLAGVRRSSKSENPNLVVKQAYYPREGPRKFDSPTAAASVRSTQQNSATEESQKENSNVRQSA